MTTLADLNASLDRGRKRADLLEPRLAKVLRPILSRAGHQAAAAFADHATSFLTAAGYRAADATRLAGMRKDAARGVLTSLTLTAAAPTSASAMVAVKPRPDEAQAIAAATGADDPPEVLHVTLAFLGEIDDSDIQAVVDALRPVAAAMAPLAGKVGGVGAFVTQDGAPQIALPDVPGLVELRCAITDALVAADIDYGREHGFQPHITVGGADQPELPDPAVVGLPLHFDAIVVARDDIPVEIPLVGAPPLTADGLTAAAKKDKPTTPAQWAAPAPSELLSVAEIVALIRSRTDPVRLAFLEAVMTDALKAAGISFDITNPFVERILAQSGAQITNIAYTTQLYVMRIIREAYEQGLSIADTAAAIRTGMAEASITRATLIAQTELAGVVNGGSLAAVQIVASATGQGYWKRWLTAPGAATPRHEDYEGLDGQTVPLDGYFDVGGAQLQFPGDPDGPPEEVCRCRCSVGYTESIDGETGDVVEGDAG